MLKVLHTKRSWGLEGERRKRKRNKNQKSKPSNVKKTKQNKTTEILRHRHFNVDERPSTGLRN